MNPALNVPRLLQIGSTGRNSGKTVVATELIQRFKQQHRLVGLKIVTITGERGKCQRGGVGCGICTSIDSGYELTEEKQLKGQKDTMRLLAAGCEQVFLLKAFTDHLLAGFNTFLNQIPADAAVICESNSLRQVVRPGLFLMLTNHRLRPIKPTAAKVYPQADLVFNAKQAPMLDQIQLNQLAWQTSLLV